MIPGAFKIGLNETQLGIAAPMWFAETMTAIVGQRQTEKLLQVGWRGGRVRVIVEQEQHVQLVYS